MVLLKTTTIGKKNQTIMGNFISLLRGKYNGMKGTAVTFNP